MHHTVYTLSTYYCYVVMLSLAWLLGSERMGKRNFLRRKWHLQRHEDKQIPANSSTRKLQFPVSRKFFISFWVWPMMASDFISDIISRESG